MSQINTSIGFLGLRPAFQSSACRFLASFSHQYPRAAALTVNHLRRNSDSIVWSPCSVFSAGPWRPYSTSVSTPSFSFRIGAAFSAKHTRFNPRSDLFSFDPAAEDQRINTGRPRSGQDAFFVSKVANGTNVAFGVADGVGGWIECGIDSAHFSHGLCKYMAKVAQGFEGSSSRIRPGALLHRGYERVLDDSSIIGGGTTACIAIAKSDGHVEVANLGDSGFVQLRLNAVHHYSNPQTHAFNTPYQLSVVPPRVLALRRIFGGGTVMDFPKDASVTSHQVRNGDVLVFATDGVWDNLTSLDVLKIVSRQMQYVRAWVPSDKGLSVSDTIGDITAEGNDYSLQTRLAVAITAGAKMASLNSRADGPFARQVQRYHPQENFHGGKVDDICVVVAIALNA